MKWKDVLQMEKENRVPPRRVEKTNEEWKRLLTADQFRVTRLHATERRFSGEYCEAFSPGIYSCVCCGTELFNSSVKFDSGTGWPSFSEPVSNNVVRYKKDDSYGMQAIEVECNVCDAHLGHVFPDGPAPTGLRYCINSLSLEKNDEVKTILIDDITTLGGGCFWCTEAVFSEIEGVNAVVSGYAGGTTQNPTYRQVSQGKTGHAEVVQVRYDPRKISYADLLRIFFATHNPTSINRQGADMGEHYRSIILYHNKEQLDTALKVIREMQSYYDKPIVTEVVLYSTFYEAEQSHKDYYRNNPENAYCEMVIHPKLQKLRLKFQNALKKKQSV